VHIRFIFVNIFFFTMLASYLKVLFLSPLGTLYFMGFLSVLLQAIELEAHAVKGVGKVHAKWSPVATAWYRMLPEVAILEQIEGDEAEELVKKCPVNVFDIEDLGNDGKRAVVAKPRACTLCRECVRGPCGEKIQLRRVRDHFIYTIESTGALPPEVLFTEAVKILEEKCERVISELS